MNALKNWSVTLTASTTVKLITNVPTTYLAGINEASNSRPDVLSNFVASMEVSPRFQAF
jgi:hypothetical protein